MTSHPPWAILLAALTFVAQSCGDDGSAGVGTPDAATAGDTAHRDVPDGLDGGADATADALPGDIQDDGEQDRDSDGPACVERGLRCERGDASLGFCDEALACRDGCMIQGALYAPEQTADSNPCELCLPDTDAFRLSTRADGFACEVPGIEEGQCRRGRCVRPGVELETCQVAPGEHCADTWVAVDGVGRALPTAEEVGPRRTDRFVGMFYWTWHETSRGGPYDVSRILADNPNDPQWGPLYAPHHWAEPELGYYTSVDTYVFRKHAALLADAGVDVIIFDTTNPPFTWPEHTRALCAVFEDMRAQGDPTPDIAFLAPFWDPAEVVRRLFVDHYAAGECQDLWFQWEGKPLIMADPDRVADHSCDACTGGVGCDSACQGIGKASGACAVPGSTDPGQCCVCYDDVPPLRHFFTFRKPEPSYYVGPSGPNQWGWLEVYPQHLFHTGSDPAEQMTVGVAQNGTNTNLAPMSLQVGIHGRSWHAGARDVSANAVLHGYNFQEQWDRALEQDPSFVFVTGWNEWVAGRHDEWLGVGGGAVFPDQYDQEYSRDIEPMVGGHSDAYYYQLAANVRRYKGARVGEDPSPEHSVTVDGDFAEWAAVRPTFRDDSGDTAHRDAPGYGGMRYVESSGRNDIVVSKVARDHDSVSFYVQTRDALTPSSDPGWMLLFIDTDDDRTTGWRGYELVVNHPPESATRTTVKTLPDLTVVASVDYRASGNQLEVDIPRDVLDQPGLVSLSFHWADNVLASDQSIAAFGVLGDNAPNRRASYRYRAQ